GRRQRARRSGSGRRAVTMAGDPSRTSSRRTCLPLARHSTGLGIRAPTRSVRGGWDSLGGGGRGPGRRGGGAGGAGGGDALADATAAPGGGQQQLADGGGAVLPAGHRPADQFGLADHGSCGGGGFGLGGGGGGGGGAAG